MNAATQQQGGLQTPATQQQGGLQTPGTQQQGGLQTPGTQQGGLQTKATRDLSAGVNIVVPSKITFFLDYSDRTLMLYVV